MHGDATSCSKMARLVPGFVDGRLPEREYQTVRSHLDQCPKCAAEARQLLQIRASMRALPRRPVPADLSVRLRVLASREQARAQQRVGAIRTVTHHLDRIDLFFHNLMRPLALPFAGGLLSTLVLFSAMLPTFNIRRTPGADTPLNDALYTEATVRSVLPVSFAEENLDVDVLVDENGRMLSYSFVDGQPVPNDPQLLRRIENTLLFTVYKPATSFGQPTPTRVRLTFRRTQMDVKG